MKDNYNVKTVIDGEVEQIPAGEVLVGDVLELTAGDKIPADCVYLEGSKLKTNEAAMTGEPIDIGKNLEKDPFLLSGTSVSEGSGRCVVVAVGGHSQWGAILKTLIVEPQSTPLQERLDALVVRVGNFGILAAILTFLASFIRWIAESVESGSWDGLKVLNFLINSVTIVVVAIPEGLASPEQKSPSEADDERPKLGETIRGVRNAGHDGRHLLGQDGHAHAKSNDSYRGVVGENLFRKHGGRGKNEHDFKIVPGAFERIVRD